MLDFIAIGGISNLLIEHVPAEVAIFDIEMRYIECSNQYLKYIGIPKANLIGQSHYDVFPEIPEHWRAVHRRVLSGESLSSDVEMFPRIDGKTDWVEWLMIPWRTKTGEVGGAILFARLMNDLKHYQQRVLGLRVALDAVIDSAHDFAVFIIDFESKIMFWSRGAEQMYGWGQEEALKQRLEILFPPNDLNKKRLKKAIELAVALGRYREREKQIKKEGHQFISELTYAPIRDNNSHIFGFFCVARDLTEEIESQRILKESEALLRSILDTVPDAMIIFDLKGQIKTFSSNAEAMFGYLASEIIGRNVSMLIPELDLSRQNEHRNIKCERNIPKRTEYFGVSKDNLDLSLDIQIGEIKSIGQPNYIAFIRDLSARKIAEKRINEIQNELAHLSRVTAVATMAAGLAHELNQPLTAITNYVQCAANLVPLGANADQAMLREALEEAGNEALRAGAIIQRLRDFVDGKRLMRQLIDIQELIENSEQLGLTSVDTHKISIHNKISPEGHFILADPVQIQQVILNLLRNAIEAMPNGGLITISVVNQDQIVHITVADSGPGIAPEKVAKLFHPFNGSKPEGMGLGLAICKMIIESHDGKLWYQAAKGGGAEFHFTLPLVDTDNV